MRRRQMVWRVTIRNRWGDNTHASKDKLFIQRIAKHWRSLGRRVDVQCVPLALARWEHALNPFALPLELIRARPLVGKTHMRRVLRLLDSPQRWIADVVASEAERAK